jgi:hypothetical protein
MKFKRLEIEDRSLFKELLTKYPPETSEMTFTNLFMWRNRYEPRWTLEEGVLFVILKDADGDYFALPPVGSNIGAGLLRNFIGALTEFSAKPKIARVSKAFVENLANPYEYEVIPDENNSDYVYLADDLINLPGNKYHKKKNHINKFKKTYQYDYRALDEDVVECALSLQEDWCEFRDCEENPDLSHEDRAIYVALTHFDILELKGGAILMDGKVEAFSFGETLNPDTAVIHIEKANPRINGLYAIINQAFCAQAWSDVKFVNREQDLGLEGLRQAKQSYYPDHMVEKFTVIPKHTIS